METTVPANPCQSSAQKLQAGAKSHRGSAVKFESNMNALLSGILAGLGEKLMM